MAQKIALGHPPVLVTIRRSKAARRLTLRLNQLNGEATLTAPRRIGQAQITRFLDRQEGWLRAQIEKNPARVFVTYGVSIPVEGEMLLVVRGKRGAVRRSPGELAVTGEPDAVGRRLVGFLKTVARKKLAKACESYADMLGESYARLTLRDTRSRWGSCTEAGNLMFSWRLVMAPPDVLDYLAAHEVTHLRHMNHSPAFWRALGELKPDFEQPRAWLRGEGVALHRFDFKAAA